MASIDNRTPRLDLPLPNKDNFLQEDVQRLQEAFTTLDTKAAELDNAGKLIDSQLPDNAVKTDSKGKVADAYLAGKVPLLDAQQKIKPDDLPKAAKTSVFSVATSAAMLTSNPEPGEICERLDDGRFFMLMRKPATNIRNWSEMVPNGVYSINDTLTGNVKNVVVKDSGIIRGIEDGVQDKDAVNKRQLDKAGGGYVSQVVWHHNRSNIPDGYFIGDGQEVSRAVNAALFAEVQAGRVPVCTEAEWQASPGKRGCYTLGATAGMFRVPDYNGVQPGSFPAPFMRGSYPSDVQYKGWMQQNAAPNITGSHAAMVPGNHGNYAFGAFMGGNVTDATTSATYEPPRAIDAAAKNSLTTNPNRYADTLKYGWMFNAWRSNNAYGRVDAINGAAASEVRPNAIVGCYIIRAAGRAINTGALDALTLATRLNGLEPMRENVGKLENYEEWLPWQHPKVLEYISWGKFTTNTNGTQTTTPGELLVKIGSNSIQIEGIVRMQITAAPLDRVICTFKKMLPGYTSIPRKYGTCMYSVDGTSSANYASNYVSINDNTDPTHKDKLRFGNTWVTSTNLVPGTTTIAGTSAWMMVDINIPFVN